MNTNTQFWAGIIRIFSRESFTLRGDTLHIKFFWLKQNELEHSGNPILKTLFSSFEISGLPQAYCKQIEKPHLADK